MSAFTSLKDIPPSPIWTGILARAVHGRELTVAVVELAPNSVVASHAHANEQLGVVLRGTMRFTIDGESRDLVAGDLYTIPSNAPHDAVTGPKGRWSSMCSHPSARNGGRWSRSRPISPRGPSSPW